MEVEQVYGEAFLRWAYETLPGRLALWLVVKRAIFSKWYGWRMRQAASRARIRPFIEKFALDQTEFLDEVDAYGSFNDFFFRKLKPQARPSTAPEGAAALPADGRHLGVADVDAPAALYAKGQVFDLPALLGDEALAERFRGGSAVISRLCPVDYHRFHAPVEGDLLESRWINGPLFSVSPIALARSLRYLWQNKRVLNLLDTQEFGSVAVLVIGATCVGSIVMTAAAGQRIRRGQELGYFAFGGSCVVTLFEKGALSLEDDLRRYGGEGTEVYAHVSDKLGSSRPAHA